MGLAMEILSLLFSIFWSYLESAYRFIFPVPRKRVEGEIALITGGGGKIGECIATELLKENVTVVLWDVNENANERVASKLRKEGAKVFAYKCDITDKDEVYKVAKKVEEDVGHVTILINNAGILIARKFLECTDNELEKQVKVNTIAHFWTTKAFLPHMCEINHGHIVTVGSAAGLVGSHNLVGYCVSKFGAVGLHESLTIELMMTGKSGVKTTCLCPCFVDTPLIGKTCARFPSMVPLLEPEFVAQELVDGMLHNKLLIVLPKNIRLNLFLPNLLTEKANRMIYKFFNVGLAEETAAVMFQRREASSPVEDKKSE